MRVVIEVDESMPVGERVMVIRRALRWSQSALAEKAGLSRGVVSNLERGCGRARGRTLEGIARALGVDFEDLVERKREPK